MVFLRGINCMAVVDMFKKLLDAYGSFFGLTHPLSKSLLLLCTLMHPVVGLMGVIGALSVLTSRKLLGFSGENEYVEVVNGLLLGMLFGSFYQCDAGAVCLTVIGGLLVVLVSAMLTETMTKHFRLPLLGLPYVVVAYLMLPFVQYCPLLPAFPPPAAVIPDLHNAALDWLSPLGAIYFNGTAAGGLIVLLALAVSSRYLAALGLMSCMMLTALLNMLAVPDLLLSLIVRMNGVLTVCVLGGLYAVPGWRSAIVALTGGFISCIMALALAKVFSLSGLPVLALPFVLACYLVFLGLSPNRGGNWLRFWLPEPTLPEQSLEQMRQASARGVDVTSVALRAPFSGTWQVWQGFFGEYTHKVPWQYALDFIQTSSGSSYKGLGSSVTDYHCYGKPILSPAYGRVVDLRYDVLDNAPGEVNTAENWGNYIIILLDCGLYVLLAHLQKDSVKVAVDSRVVPGQLLAFAGNSGRSPQPHLHMHVQEGILPGTRTVPFHLTGVIENSHDFTNYTLRSCPKERALITAPNRNAALKKALHLNVGNHLQFEVAKTNHKTASATFSVTMDLAGHYALESKSGARVSFCTTDDVVAFYDRTGPDDDVLDAVILSIGLTPLTEGSITWTDQVPRRLLPMPVATRVLSTIIKPFSTCEQSVYERKWDPILQIWTQIGKHTVSGLGPFNWTCLTEAHLCEATGLVKFKLIANGETTIEAALAAYGVPDDNEGPDITAAEPASA